MTSDADANAPSKTFEELAEENLTRVAQDITTAEQANAAAYDKAIMTLSSAALAFSLTFTEDVVKIATARWVGLLLASWAGFALALAVTILNFIVALSAARRQKKAAFEVFRHRTKSAEKLQREVDRDNRWQHRMNVTQGVVFLVAMLLFGAYIAINVYPRNGHG